MDCEEQPSCWSAESASSAFEALVKQHVPFVFRTSKQILGDVHAAEDATQSVMIDFARKAASLKEQNARVLWLHRAAVCASLEWLRKEKRRQRKEKEAAAIRESSSDLSTLRSDDLCLLHQAVNALPAPLREVLVLRYFLGKSPGQIAEIAGRSRRTVEHRHATAVKRLRRQLSACDYDLEHILHEASN